MFKNIFLFNKIEVKIFENPIFTRISSAIVFFLSNLNLECFQFLFDVCIVHINENIQISENCPAES